MYFFLTENYNWESKLDHAIKNLELRDLFAERKYGEDLSGGIGVVLMCREPALDFKQRIRLSKKQPSLSMDVMLDLPFFVSATHAQRREVVAKSLVYEISRIVKKYRFTSLMSKTSPVISKESFLSNCLARTHLASITCVWNELQDSEFALR